MAVENVSTIIPTIAIRACTVENLLENRTSNGEDRPFQRLGVNNAFNRPAANAHLGYLSFEICHHR